MTLNFVKEYFLLFFYLFSYPGFWIFSQHFKNVSLSNFLGFLALFFYLLSLAPTMFRTLSPKFQKNKMLLWLRQNRRTTGILAFLLASNHGLLITLERKLNFLSLSTIFEYFQGVSMFFILSLLTITSSDVCVKKLKENWFKLHKLTYLILFILPYHIFDKTKVWSFLTPLGLLLNLIFLVLFLKRLKITFQIKNL